MASRNPFDNLLQNIRESIFNIPMHEQVNDEEMECLHFGFCSKSMTSPRPDELFFGK